MPYRFVDNIATADCAVEITGSTVEEVFAASVEALTAIMTDPSSVASELEWPVEVSASGLTELLYAWLAELIYLKDVEASLLAGVRKCTISEWATSECTESSGGCFKIQATVTGEKIDYTRHDIAVDVKAVTFYRFELKETNAGWKAFVVFDL